MSAAGDAPILTARGVTKSFGPTKVLKGIDLDLHEREVLCLIGPSGSGKSTMLRCLNHLETIDQGAIHFRGELIGYVERGDVLVEASERALARQRARIGMVFQNFNLFGHMTALQNVMVGPLLAKKLGRQEAATRARRLLESVGLADRAGHYPVQLSGGQQQRVAIARALAMEPELLLLDEPTSALDPELVGEVLDIIRSLAANGTTMVIVTHEMGLVRDIADRVVFMADGLVVETGPADQIFDNPRTAALRSFLGRHSRASAPHRQVDAPEKSPPQPELGVVSL